MEINFLYSKKEEHRVGNFMLASGNNIFKLEEANLYLGVGCPLDKIDFSTFGIRNNFIVKTTEEKYPWSAEFPNGTRLEMSSIVTNFYDEENSIIIKHFAHPNHYYFALPKYGYPDGFRIEYVHQLQNFYFYLTGKELKLKFIEE